MAVAATRHDVGNDFCLSANAILVPITAARGNDNTSRWPHCNCNRCNDGGFWTLVGK